MRFYTRTHKHYFGIDLHARSMYVCVFNAEGVVLLTGGLAADVGLAKAMRERVEEDEMEMEIRTHPRSIYAGALGAALWGAFRHRMLETRTAGAA